MLRRSLVFVARLCVAAAAVTVGCADDLDLEPPVLGPDIVGGPVEAQFDPTNPVPVFRLVPTPTFLAQNPDGSLNPEAVEPAACELPTTSQCLAFVSGWPTNLPITLFFSDEIDTDPAKLLNDIELYEVGANGAFTEVPLDPNRISLTRRAAPAPEVGPADACKVQFEPSFPTYDLLLNGTTDAEGREVKGFTDGYQLDIFPLEDAIPQTPGADLKFQTQYILLVKSEANGLTDTDGDPVEPSGLFFLLNSDEVPVQPDGFISSALLRSQVQSGLLLSVFNDALIEELSPQQRQELDRLTLVSGQSLRSLYEVFEQIIQASLGNQVIQDRSDVIFVNTWTTGPPPVPTPVFDATTQSFPSPAAELLINVDAQGRRQLALPESSGIPPELLPGLNKLDGFSLRTPPTIGLSPETGPAMSFGTNAPIDPNTLADSVVMYRLDADGNAQETVQLAFLPTATATSVTVLPLAPLAPDTSYVIGVTQDLKRADGGDFAPSATFQLFQVPVPIDQDIPDNPEQQAARATVLRQLECSPLLSGGSALLPPMEAEDFARELEPFRGRWQATFQALERQSIARTELLLAWTYTTQSITGQVDSIKATLFSGGYDDASDRVMPTGIRFTGSATLAAAMGVVPRVCVPQCQLGQLPGLAPVECVMGGQINPGIASNEICRISTALATSDIGSMERFMMRTHRMTSGSPFVDGTLSADKIAAPEPVDVPVWVFTPSTPPVDGKYPVAIFQHGITKSKGDGFLVANTLAQAGWASIMMDLPWHGERASDVTRLVNGNEEPCPVPVDPAAVTCDFDADVPSCTGGCDGVPDTGGAGYLSTNLSGTRDNLRQTAIDHLTLLYTIQQASQPNGAWAFLDADNIAYVGVSFGSITGANFLAYVNRGEIDVAVLNAGGGDLIELVQTSLLGVPLLQSLEAQGICEYVIDGDPTSGCQPTPTFVTFLSLADWALQAGDPLHAAGAVVERFGTDRILFQVASPDPIVPNAVTESLVGRYGLSTSDDIYQTYDFSQRPAQLVENGFCHEFLFLPVCGACAEASLCTTVGAQQQMAAFVDAHGQQITPQNPDQVAGFSCVDPCGP